MSIVHEILFRLKLFIFGVTFYEQAKSTGPVLISEATYNLISGHSIVFKFYRVECYDTTLRRNSIFEEAYDSYIVEAHTSPDFPDDPHFFNGKRFFFNGVRNGFGRSSKLNVERILDIYLDYLRLRYESKESSQDSKD